jgi:hypothetical protein
MRKREGLPQLLLVLTLVLLMVSTPGRGFGATEDNEKEAPEASGKQDIQEIGKQLNNPVSSIWNITTQSNMYFEKGNLSSAYRGQFVVNFQPVLPIPLTKDWNLIPRPVIPFLSNPYIRGVDTVNHTLDWSRTAGMGDIAFVTFLSPNLPRWILEVGPGGSGGFHHQRLGGPYFCSKLVVRGGHPPNPGDQPNELSVRSGAHAAGGLADSNDPQCSSQLAGHRRQLLDLPQRFNIRFTFKPVLPNLVKKPILE